MLTKCFVRLEVQLIVFMMNGNDQSSLYRFAHISKRLFTLEAQIHFPSMNNRKKKVKTLPAVRLCTCQICLESVQDKLIAPQVSKQSDSYH